MIDSTQRRDLLGWVDPQRTSLWQENACEQGASTSNLTRNTFWHSRQKIPQRAYFTQCSLLDYSGACLTTECRSALRPADAPSHRLDNLVVMAASHRRLAVPNEPEYTPVVLVVDAGGAQSH